LGNQVRPHIDHNRSNQLSKPGGLTDEELEHIADCGDCGQRVFNKLFAPNCRAKAGGGAGME